MSEAGITQQELRTELAQQLLELKSNFEAEFGRLAEKMRQGVKEELEGWKADNLKPEATPSASPPPAPPPAARSASPPPAPARSHRGKQHEIGGRPQTGGLSVLSRSTSSLASGNVLLNMLAEEEEEEEEEGSKESDAAERAGSKEAARRQLAEQATLELMSNPSEDSMGFFSRHRRGYMAGRELHDDLRSSTMSIMSVDGQQGMADAMSVHEEPRPSWREMTGEQRQGFLRALVNGPYFHMGATVFILLNAVLLGMQTDSMAKNLSEEEPVAFKVLERAFCVVFLLELALRVWAAAGMRNFLVQDDWQWNVFDALVVGLQTVDVVLEFILEGINDLGSEELHGNLSIVRVLRILRFVRIIRVLRTLRSVSELRTIIVSIFGTFRTLMWTLALLFLVIFMIAVTITQIVAYHLINEAEADVMMQLELQKHYGSLGGSVLVLFQAITNGLDWEDMLNPLMDHISGWLALPVCIYIGFGVFALMNIVTGVFVESALESARREKERFLLHTVQNLFKTTDEDKSGDISWNEFQAKLNTSAMHLYFKTIDLDMTEAEDLFHLIDVNDSGSIDPEEFVNGCIRLQGPAKAIDLATLMHEFKRSHRTIKQSHRALTTAMARIRNRRPEPISTFV